MHTAVFDIGKTNKRVVVFDANWAVLHQDVEQFEPVEDEDGVPCDDLAQIYAWIDTTLVSLIEQFEVQRLNFSAYGAALVHLDADDEPTTPLYSYLKPVGYLFSRKLYRAYGGIQQFCAVTGSPPLNMMNAGLQLVWLRKFRPAAFAKTHTTLHLAQYLSWRFTGRKVSDYTSVGCHTALWDFGRSTYHEWTRRPAYQEKLPPVVAGTTASDVEWRGHTLRVGCGLHNTSAALVPYLAREEEPFVLLCLGTWSVAFNPWNTTPLTTYELSRDCLTFMQPNGRPVKATRLFLGYEHDARTAELAEHYAVHVDTFKLVRYRPELDTRGQARRFIWDHLAQGIPRGTGRHFDDPDYMRAYHRLLRELADVQINQMRLIAAPSEVKRLFVDGSLSRSQPLLEMLRQAYPNALVQASTNPIGSALGAGQVLDQA